MDSQFIEKRKKGFKLQNLSNPWLYVRKGDDEITLTSKSTSLACPNPQCKKTVSKPILLTNLSERPVESYYACPRCLIKLDLPDEPVKSPETVSPKAEKTPTKEAEKVLEEVEPQETSEATLEELPEKPLKEIPEEKPEKPAEPLEELPEETPAKPPEPSEPKGEAPPGCPHYLGYLSKRPKDASIPDACLTCRKMVKCMLEL
jgi:hypothetical protein